MARRAAGLVLSCILCHEDETTAGHIRVVDGEHAGDPTGLLTQTAHLLDHAAIAARGLAQLLDGAADTLTWAAARTPDTGANPGDSGR